MKNINQQLFQKNLITEKQFDFFEEIRNNERISLYFELRTILYLGIMLFTGGIGYFAYQNMSNIGHILSMLLLTMAIVVGFYFINKFSKPFASSQVIVEHAFFDYILILVSLLIISLFAYIQVYFDLVALLLRWTSFISAAILFFMAYRYDNRALLSMGITALAAAVGISISLVNWTNGDWMTSNNLYVTGIFLGIALVIAGQISDFKNIKKHFKFTYQNFGLILYFSGGIASIFDSQYEISYSILIFITAGFLTYYSWKQKEFLYFIYANIAGYIALLYLLISIIDLSNGGYMFYIYFIPMSCIGYIIFLITKKSHFAND